jgi:hypothetical protein
VIGGDREEAFSFGFSRSIRASAASVTSTGERVFAR